MNIRDYIDSGSLEAYCLGMLNTDRISEVESLRRKHPEVESEIRSIEAALRKYAKTVGSKMSETLQDEIWELLANVNRERTIRMDCLPLINRFSDPIAWLEFAKPLIPEPLADDRFIQVLRKSDTVVQMLLKSKTDFVNEVHTSERESFIILEGECECTVGNTIFQLGPGGFTEIPLFTDHDVRILTPHVTAILQRVAV